MIDNDLKPGDVLFGAFIKYNRFGDAIDFYPRKITIVRLTKCYIFYGWNKISMTDPNRLKKVGGNDKFFNTNKLELLKFMLEFLNVQEETSYRNETIKRNKKRLNNEYKKLKDGE